MGIKNIDFKQIGIADEWEYTVDFQDEFKARIFYTKARESGYTVYDEIIGNFSIKEKGIGRTYIGENHRGIAPERDSNTLLEEYLPEAITHLEEIQTNPKVKEYASFGKPFHKLMLATETLLNLYKKEVRKQKVGPYEGISGSIEF